MENEIKLFIHGEHVNSSDNKTFDNINPVNQSKLSKVHIANQDDIEKAVNSSLEGFEEWSQYS